MISVAPLNGSVSEWDAFAASAPESTFCHLAGWRDVIASVLGHDCPYAVATDDEGAWRGLLPLVRVRSPLFGHYLVSLPFLNGGGPLGAPAAVVALAGHATGLARRMNVDLLELRTRHLVASPLRVSDRKISVRLDLPAATESLWRQFPAKLRSQIRRARKEALEARFGADQLEPFYEVFARNMRSLGTPVLPRAFFERIAATFGDFVVFGAVYQRAQPVAAGCGFAWRDEFEMTWASSLREHNRVAPNMLLYWSFMERMIARGMRVFDFGRCTAGSGTHRFKRQWGGADVSLPWLQWSPRDVASTPSPERPLYRLATAVWRRLPLAVTNRVGPLLARQLP
jgi:FemAB-related protein (PEP-CTERM system-associated)